MTYSKRERTGSLCFLSFVVSKASKIQIYKTHSRHMKFSTLGMKSIVLIGAISKKSQNLPLIIACGAHVVRGKRAHVVVVVVVIKKK